MMNTRQANMGRNSRVRDNNHVVFIDQFRQLVVSCPSIGQNFGTTFNNIANERHQTFTRHIRYPAHPYASEPPRRMNFNRKNHNLLIFTTSPSLAVNLSLFHLGAATESISTRACHGLPQFMQPRKSRLIAPQAKHAFQSQSACPVLLTDHEPHRSKPDLQGYLRPIKNGPSCYRDLTSAMPASGFIGKPFHELLIYSRVVLNGYQSRMGTLHTLDRLNGDFRLEDCRFISLWSFCHGLAPCL